MQILNNNDLILCKCNLNSFEHYTDLVGKYLKIDCRETIVQNRIIVPFLDTLFLEDKDILVIDTSTQYKNKESKLHDLSQYRSMEVGSAPPDIMVVKNWNYNNRDKDDIQYLATIEIKSPLLDPVNNRDSNEYNSHTKREISCHLQACTNVILTDSFRWHFYQCKSGLKIKEKIVDLHDEKEDWNIKFRDNIEWRKFCDLIVAFIRDGIMLEE